MRLDRRAMDSRARPQHIRPVVDRQASISRGLHLCVPYAMTQGAFDIAGGRSPTASSGLSSFSTRFGPCRRFATKLNTPSEYWSGLSLNATSVSVEAWWAYDSLDGTNTANIQAMFGGGDGPTSIFLARLGDTSTSGFINCQCGVGAGKIVGPAWPSYGQADFHQLVLVGRGSAAEVYLDGALVATGSAASDPIARLCLWSDDNGANTARATVSTCLQFNAWNRPLSSGEVRARYDNPWNHLRESPAPALYAPPAPPPTPPPWQVANDFPAYGYVEG